MNTSDRMIVVSGPSGAGKTTLANHLIKEMDIFTFAVSATTRKPRKGEVHGKHYYFFDENQFRQKIRDNEFVEYEEVYEGILYGTLKSELERIWKAGKIPLLDVDVKGALKIRQKFGMKGFFIFIHPGNTEVLRQRLQKRGTETGDSIEHRIARFKEEVEFIEHFNEILDNDNLKEAIAKFSGFARDYVESISTEA